MRAQNAIRATAVALVLGLLSPAASDARGGRAHPRARKHSGKSTVAARQAPKHRARPVAKKPVPASRPELYGPFLPADARTYGPFLPVVAFDHPLAPCPPADVPIQARLHDENLDTDEAQASDESPDEAVPADASRSERLLSADRVFSVARRIGSFLRPKSASARVTPADVDLGELLSANLRIPVEGVDAERLRDSFLEGRGRYRKHLAIDIGAPRGTPVIATADGEIVRLRRERRGGISIYQKDESGKYLFFYCHLSKYARGLAIGQKVAAGDVIGYVGATGHVIGGPHLHFSITRVPEDDDFREGLAVNPYLLFLAGVP